MALDRYSKRNKTNWEIGRDYEMYNGYLYSKEGYNVSYFGIDERLADLGRDLIVYKGGKIGIIQCKYWAKHKLIHEKHIAQLYGTMIQYVIENNCDINNVSGIFITNIQLSDMAKKFAKYLGIIVIENRIMGDYPQIKCNLNKSEGGDVTKIYHLPFDQQYDRTKIDKPGEFYSFTVQDAVNKGFRRAKKYFPS